MAALDDRARQDGDRHSVRVRAAHALAQRRDPDHVDRLHRLEIDPDAPCRTREHRLERPAEPRGLGERQRVAEPDPAIGPGDVTRSRRLV
jgi:hypothetical protein